MLDSRQIKKRIALLKLGAPAGATVESILDKINVEVDSPLRIAASATPDAILNFSSSLVPTADGANEVVSPVKKQIFSGLVNPTINFQTQALSNAADFDITWGTATLSQFRFAAFTLVGSGKIKVLFSTEYGSEAALIAAVNPGSLYIAGGLPIGYVTLQATNASPAAYKTSGSATNIIENAKIYRFGSGSGGGSSASGSGTGAEVIDLRYRAEIQDSFADIPGLETPTDTAANKTDPTLHDVANELFRFSYDASKTVTGTGTAMSLSAAPTFTVKVGDVLVVGNEVREITVLGSINANGTGFTIASAFTTNPAAAAANVSQAIYTKDLNAFDANGTGLAVSSQITDNVSNVLVNYEDSTTLADIIPDWGTAPVIAYHVTADNSNWTDKQVRQTILTGTTGSVSVSVPGAQFRIRFFANKTSGSGQVNLLSYKAFWHEQVSDAFGSTYNTAFANLADSDFVNVTHSVASGKSRFTFNFTYPRGLNAGNPAGSALEVFVNGQQVPRFETGITSVSQAYFTEINDMVIEMDTDYSTTGLEFMFKVPVTVVDSNSSNTTRITAVEDSVNQAVDAQVVASFLTAVLATPSATQFRSDITNRSKIPNPAANLSVSLGTQRMMIQNIYRVMDEFGLAGQSVFRISDDKLNQIRLAGNWSMVTNDQGFSASSTTVDDYMEVVWFGTALNLLVYQGSGTGDFRVSIDGGAESANLYVANSTALDARGYGKNTLVTVIGGLTLGLHTAKIRIGASTSNGLRVYGVELINQSTTLTVATGTAIRGKYENSLSAIAIPAYNSTFESGVLGTRGGNVVVYIKNDNTIAKALTPTNAAQANLTSADHTNEEQIRAYHPREFGANRADDFSTANGTGLARGFTLDDAVTTLNSSSGIIDQALIATLPEAFCIATGTTNFATFTFVGSGLDLLIVNDASARTVSVTVDGVSIGNITSSGTVSGLSLAKVVSGLPFGTHTVRLTNSSAAVKTFGIVNFIVYAPKKPVTPANAVELGQYYLTADHAATYDTNSSDSIASGVIGKVSVREFQYIGANWAVQALTTTHGRWGFHTSPLANNSQTSEVPFWGTGVVVECENNGVGFNIYIDGVLNATGAVSGATNGGGGLYTGSGVWSRVTFTGLSLARHTVRVERIGGGGGFFRFTGVYAITPIYVPSINMPAIFQNIATVGSTSLADLRNWNKRDVIEQVNAKVSVAKGVANAPTSTATTFVPMSDMSVPYYSDGEWVEVTYNIRAAHSAINGQIVHSLFVDGLQVAPAFEQWSPTAGAHIMLSLTFPVYLAKGFHNITAMWAVITGTGTLPGTGRVITAKKIEVNN